MTPVQINPMDWAQAGLAFIQGGGWSVIALVALLIVCKWPPWRKGEK